MLRSIESPRKTRFPSNTGNFEPKGLGFEPKTLGDVKIGASGANLAFSHSPKPAALSLVTTLKSRQPPQTTR